MGKRILRTGLVGAVLASGTMLAMPGMASASSSRHFKQDQTKLEAQLVSRVGQLGRLSADVAAATTLTAAHAALLNARITADTANVNALVAKVPTDTTVAELNTDRAAMLRDNRVFAVVTPQVFQTIEADGIALQVSTDEGNETSLQASVTSLIGQHGYTNALNHYMAFVRSVNAAATDSADVTTAELAQTPADYPGDTHVFVHANGELLNADLALAHAAYDVTVIGLASGGYTGS